MAGGVLAIDHGAKKSGFAAADPLRIAVAPLACVHLDGESEALVDHVAGLLAERDVETILLGVPGNPTGPPRERVDAALRLAERLRARFAGTEVVLYDETLTTKEAESRLSEAGFHGRARKARRDSWSAWVLLDDWLRAGEPR